MVLCCWQILLESADWETLRAGLSLSGGYCTELWVGCSSHKAPFPEYPWGQARAMSWRHADNQDPASRHSCLGPGHDQVTLQCARHHGETGTGHQGSGVRAQSFQICRSGLWGWVGQNAFSGGTFQVECTLFAHRRDGNNHGDVRASGLEGACRAVCGRERWGWLGRELRQVGDARLHDRMCALASSCCSPWKDLKSGFS